MDVGRHTVAIDFNSTTRNMILTISMPVEFTSSFETFFEIDFERSGRRFCTLEF